VLYRDSSRVLLSVIYLRCASYHDRGCGCEGETTCFVRAARYASKVTFSFVADSCANRGVCEVDKYYSSILTAIRARKRRHINVSQAFTGHISRPSQPFCWVPGMRYTLTNPREGCYEFPISTFAMHQSRQRPTMIQLSPKRMCHVCAYHIYGQFLSC
jgi:hypothetical protein